LVENFLQYPGEFHQEEGISEQISEGTLSLELSFRNSMEIPTDHVTGAAAGKNVKTRGSATAITDTTRVARTPKLNCKFNFNLISNETTLAEMGITLPETTNTQSGIPLRLDPPCMESNQSAIDSSLLDSLQSTLLKPETEMDFGGDPPHVFLLDQDVGLVTLCNSSRPPVLNFI